MCELTNKIKEIAERIPDNPKTPSLSDFREISNGVTRYRLKKGYASSTSLFKHKNASIALTRIPDGGHFMEHEHIAPVEYELILMLSGKLLIEIGEEKRELSELDMVRIEKEVKHNATAVGDALFVAITIPADYEGFP